MLVGVGVAPLPPSFPPTGTFYFINRPNCVNICNTVYVHIQSHASIKCVVYLPVSGLVTLLCVQPYFFICL